MTFLLIWFVSIPVLAVLTGRAIKDASYTEDDE